MGQGENSGFRGLEDQLTVLRGRRHFRPQLKPRIAPLLRRH